VDQGGAREVGSTEPDVDSLVSAVLLASRALVGIAARSLAAAPAHVTLVQYRLLVLLVSRGPQTPSALAAAATVLTVAGGGAGGLFIPLVVEGALIGRTLGGLFRTSASGSNFFPLIGVSAFLGAGYRVPLAAVVFAAEGSGRPGFIVPGLIAAMVSQLFMGSASAST